MTRTPSSSRAARSAFAAALVGVLALAVGCAPEPEPADPTTSAPSPTATAPAPPTPTASPDPAAALGLEGCVGQVLMVGTPVDTVSPDAAAAIRDRGVGGLFLHGRSSSGVEATAALVAQFRDLAIDGSPELWVATDQEGGEVQVLSGPGFDEIPYAIRQADLGPDALRTAATAWGGQLAAAGIDVNLAPVADIVTSAETRLNNPPIGALGRQYGYDEQAVAAGAGAFADGMRASGVLPTFKHFPGLGRVDANTDYTAEVLDSVVSADSPDVDVYRELTASGPSLVMVGTARYQHIDPDHPAAFSPAVLGLLRDRVGFDGVVITDDLSAAAAAEIVAPGDRAVEALSAGVDIVLASADPTVLPAMYDAVLARAQSDPAFAARVDESCGRVLEAKDAGTAD
ncbi:glycoside hydrolase family 3 protein [Microbacterium sp. H37-C3]|uniref:glycoside hydrolase family 3 N-terminal domain-containing protein n=1 Tax=Microbacterium sp. H37-C3 TaxID=3004354 RepID=UPI0022AEE58B|nr:glycoside hydrolase family 3 N-terminal domain-containing protein [Microbacterium sp. H37-C3]MCZ4067185.1 glycoside hydrolase family 3 protein [Microbacterium sp. H37-C3]